MPARSVRAAIVQASSRPFDTEGALEIVADRTDDAVRAGAQLVLFPEAFVGGYPWGLSFGTVVGGRTDAGRRTWQRYRDAAIELPGPFGTRLAEIAANAGVYLAVGVVERDGEASHGTLYCTLAYFGPDGSLLGKHRKLKPTAAERFIWGEGDGSTLTVLETPLGRIGGLICWENYMPMARMSMYGKGVEIYLAPTADGRERWQATLRHIAPEGRCFVLGCNQVVRRGVYPSDLEVLEELDGGPDLLCRGGSAAYSPLG